MAVDTGEEEIVSLDGLTLSSSGYCRTTSTGYECCNWQDGNRYRCTVYRCHWNEDSNSHRCYRVSTYYRYYDCSKSWQW